MELKKFRDEFVLTRYEVCQELGIREMSLYNWESNNHNPSQQHRKAILDYMKKFRARMEAEEKREIEKYRDSVLAGIYGGEHTFIPVPEKSGKFSQATCPTGKLWHSITLLRLQEITKASEGILIKILEQLTQQGLVRLFHIACASRLSSKDIHFKLELGTARRDIYKRSVEAVRLYKKQPLSKTELESKEIILNIQERIDYLRADKKAFFDSRHGKPSDSALERQFAKEDREADLEKHRATIRTAEGIEKLIEDKEK